MAGYAAGFVRRLVARRVGGPWGRAQPSAQVRVRVRPIRSLPLDGTVPAAGGVAHRLVPPTDTRALRGTVTRQAPEAASPRERIRSGRVPSCGSPVVRRTGRWQAGRTEATISSLSFRRGGAGRRPSSP